MFTNNLKLKLLLVVFLLLILDFANQFWVDGVFVTKGTPQNNVESPLDGLSALQLNDLEQSDLFGIYQQEESASADTEIEELFAPENNQYIGQIGNFRYILYATAQYADIVSAKLLVKNIDTEEVEVMTVKRGDDVANSVVTEIALSSLVLKRALVDNQGEKESANNVNQVTLKLFSKIVPSSPSLNED